MEKKRAFIGGEEWEEEGERGRKDRKKARVGGKGLLAIYRSMMGPTGAVKKGSEIRNQSHPQFTSRTHLKSIGDTWKCELCSDIPSFLMKSQKSRTIYEIPQFFNVLS